MIEHKGKNLVRMDCEQAHGVLEKQMLAVSLTPEEQEQLNQHLTECRECDAFSTIAHKLKQFVPQSSTERYRELAIAAQARYRDKRRRNKTRVTVSLLTTAAAVALLFFWAFSGRKPWTTIVDQDQVTLASSLSSCEPLEPITVSGGAITVVFCDHAEADPPVQTARGFEVHLRSGVIAARVQRWTDEKQRFSVITPEGRVAVKGTVFAVESMAKETRVHVAQGVVELIPVDTARGSSLFVSAGQSAKMGDDRPFASALSISSLVDRMLGDGERRDRQSAETHHDPTALHSPDALDGAPANQNESPGYWTFWFDRDDPTGNGDAESLSAFIAGGFPVCLEPTMVECRTTPAHVDWRQTGDRLVCRPERGAFCLNKEQTDGRCEDYEVRFFCNRGDQ